MGTCSNVHTPPLHVIGNKINLKMNKQKQQLILGGRVLIVLDFSCLQNKTSCLLVEILPSKKYLKSNDYSETAATVLCLNPDMHRCGDEVSL